MTASSTITNEPTQATDHLVVVSADTHSGPRVAEDLRPYCPRQHLEAFDEFAEALRRKHEESKGQMGFGGMTRSADWKVSRRNLETEGHFDIHARPPILEFHLGVAFRAERDRRAAELQLGFRSFPVAETVEAARDLVAQHLHVALDLLRLQRERHRHGARCKDHVQELAGKHVCIPPASNCPKRIAQRTGDFAIAGRM